MQRFFDIDKAIYNLKTQRPIPLKAKIRDGLSRTERQMKRTGEKRKKQGFCY